MTELAWVISILAALYIGYSYQRLLQAIRAIKEALPKKVDKPSEEKKSDILDPYDVTNRAREEHEAMMKRLNP